MSSVYHDDPRPCRVCGLIQPSNAFRPRRNTCKVCERAAALQRYHDDRATQMIRMAAWKRANPDKVKANWQKWQQGNVEYQKTRFAAYRAVHKGHLRVRKRTWDQKNYEHTKAYSSNYRKTHRALYRAANHRRSAREHAAGGCFTVVEWQTLCMHYDHTCLQCGRREPEIKLTIDHVIPISKGGRNDIGNLQPLCFSCNSSKKDRTIDYRPYWDELLNLPARVPASTQPPQPQVAPPLPPNTPPAKGGAA